MEKPVLQEVQTVAEVQTLQLSEQAVQVPALLKNLAAHLVQTEAEVQTRQLEAQTAQAVPSS